jgi:pteridine reductase
VPSKKLGTEESKMTITKVALITGAARRIGEQITRALHDKNWNVIIHYHRSENEAMLLAAQLNEKRPNSALCLKADLNNMQEVKTLAEQTMSSSWKRLDALIHNASSFFPTPLGAVSETEWDNLMNSNLKAPFFLSQCFIEELKRTQGSIIHLLDIHALKPKLNYSVYCAAKAALWFLTKAFALELAPSIRVNGIAPGAILWAEGINEPDSDHKKNTLAKIPLHRIGTPQDIVEAIFFLLSQSYITGHVLPIDGGRNVI